MSKAEIAIRMLNAPKIIEKKLY
uniref:Uncharacterized protein n=1 Tax=Lepeophtheirus salmonis TaxID=72036 RepID=A0A0K2V2V3_LEPSM